MDGKADIWHSKETILSRANTVSKRLAELDLDYLQETQQYEVQSKLFVFADLKDNPSFNVKRHKNTLYLGLLNQNQQREGLGVLLYRNGRTYEGEWVADQRNGRGYELFSNGAKYVGIF